MSLRQCFVQGLLRAAEWKSRWALQEQERCNVASIEAVR